MKAVVPIVIIVLAVFLLLPVVCPKPPSAEQMRKALEKHDFTIYESFEIDPPGLQSVRQTKFVVDGADVYIYKYDDAGKIAKEFEFSKPDAGSAIVETWNLSETLGAAPPAPPKESVAKKGMYMLKVYSQFPEVREEICQIFREL